MSRTLIIAEHDGNNLNPSTSKCASCAAAIGQEFDIIVMGASIGGVAGQAAAIDGASTVIAVDAEHLANPLAVNYASEVVAMADGYSHILGPSTTFGRDLMPRRRPWPATGCIPATWVTRTMRVFSTLWIAPRT